MDQPTANVANMLRENWFWSQILRDHATMIHDNLAPDEEEQARWALGFKQAFTQLFEDAASMGRTAGIPGPAGSYALTGFPPEPPLASLQGEALLQLEQDATKLSRTLLDQLTALRSFKEQLIQKKLDYAVKFGLTAVFLRHMLNEAEEAHRVLTRMRDGAPLPPVLESLHQHMLWLPDAAGHAVGLYMEIDGVEAELQNRCRAFQHLFDAIHRRALETYYIMRNNPRPAGIVRWLNQESMAAIADFRTFLSKLREDLEARLILVGGLNPMIPDHMLREELYYNEKINAIRLGEQ
ncbi:MAG: DUF2935 domain-containing protein [Mycobacterium leprae]